MESQPSEKLPKAIKYMNVPFYAVPDNVKTCSEIINEARASVKPLETKRPFTPRDGQRQLFDNVGRSWLPTTSNAISGFSCENVELHFSLASAPPRLNPLAPKQAVISSIPSEKELERNHIRKICSAPGKIRLPSLLQPKKVNFPSGLDKLAEEGTVSNLSDGTVVDVDKEKKTCITKLTETEVKHLDESKETRTETADLYFNSNVLPLVNQLGCKEKRKKEDSEFSSILKQLYKTLEEGDLLGKPFKQRALVLKTIFKTFESGNPMVLLQAAKLSLAMNVSGNNLTSVSKVVFKVSRDNKNDIAFLEDDILGNFIEKIKIMDPLQCTESLIYGYGALKFLSQNSKLLREISLQEGILNFISDQLKQINNHKMNSSEDQQPLFHLLWQLTGFLRNLAEYTANRRAFVTSGTICHLCTILKAFNEDSNIIMNVARILSKLTMYYEICNAVTSNKDCFSAGIHLLDIYKQEKELVVRLCFAFGNVVARNESARLMFFEQPNALDTVLDLIVLNLKNTVEFSDRHKHLRSFTKSEPSEEEKSSSVDVSEDVIIKSLRLLANMSISFDVGRQIAESEFCLNVLLLIFEKRDAERHEELVLSAIATLSNLSFYSTENERFTATLAKLVDHIIRCLSVDNLDVVIEGLRALGNISRTQDARNYLFDKEVLETAIGFLGIENKDVIYLSCGLLMNFVIEERSRIRLRKENGVEKLLNILREFGQSDWQLASIICQTLWNYSCEPSAFSSHPFDMRITAELQGLLLKYLDESRALSPSSAKVREPQKEIARDIWQLEFCPVASRLLSKIQTQV